MRNLIVGLTLLLVMISGIALGDPPKADGWFCESLNGTCWAYKDGCDDESCHWRKHAYVVEFPDNASYLAFETEQICERLRNKLRANGLENGKRCRRMSVTD